MAETSRAGTVDFACRNWRYRCSTMLNCLGNLSIIGTFLIILLPPVMIADNNPHLHNTGYFLDCYLLSVTDRSIWIPYLARYSERIKKHNFQVVKWKSTFIWKNAFPGRIGNRWITFGYNLRFASHPSIRHVRHLISQKNRKMWKKGEQWSVATAVRPLWCASGSGANSSVCHAPNLRGNSLPESQSGWPIWISGPIFPFLKRCRCWSWSAPPVQVSCAFSRSSFCTRTVADSCSVGSCSACNLSSSVFQFVPASCSMLHSP